MNHQVILIAILQTASRHFHKAVYIHTAGHVNSCLVDCTQLKVTVVVRDSVCVHC